MDLIYARQSVDKEDSISIESQIELCLRENTSGEHKIFKDKEIADMSADIYGKKDVGVIKNYLNNWESISISDKITVVDALIESVRVNQDTVDIVWKI